MNYKRIFTIILAVSFFPLSSTFAKDAKGKDNEKPKVSKAEYREIFKSRIKKNEFGDLSIVKFPEVDLKEIQSKSQALTPLMALFLSYVDNDIDFVRLNKLMAKASGANKKGNGCLPIAGLMDGFNKYLGNKSMGLSKINFSGVNARQKLGDGVPIFLWLASSNIYDTQLSERTDNRKKAESASAWLKDLKKAEVKKITKNLMVTDALCIGYNDITGEFLIIGAAKNPIWMTEKEIKSGLTGSYILRY